METAWLNSQGLLYIVVSLFSTRILFYAFGPYLAIITILLGLIREQERKLRLKEGDDPDKKKEKKAKKGKESASDEVASDEVASDAVLADEEPASVETPAAAAAGSDIMDFDV